MKFAVSGLGNIFPRHQKAIEAIGGTIVATYDPDKSRGGSVTSYEDLLQSDADYVVILSPNKYHLEQVLLADAAGKKVIVEKPPVMSLHDLYQLPKDMWCISQLRGLPFKKFETISCVRLNIIAHRDPHYLAGWRGKDDWSGGLLYTIGIHYFDFLIQQFGKVTHIDYVRWVDDWHCEGALKLENAIVSFRIMISEDRPNQKQIKVNGEEVDFGEAFENLHIPAYQAIMDGRGIHPQDMVETLYLLDKIYATKN